VSAARLVIEDGVVVSVERSSRRVDGDGVIEGRGRWLSPEEWSDEKLPLT
jgi:N-acyl-D-aspartate/D-glutamate deacylase